MCGAAHLTTKCSLQQSREPQEAVQSGRNPIRNSLWQRHGMHSYGKLLSHLWPQRSCLGS